MTARAPDDGGDRPPQPVLPLGYASPRSLEARLPTRTPLIWLGVASLVVGLLSIFASGHSARSWNDIWRRSVPPPALTGTPLPNNAAPLGEIIGPQGMKLADRRKVLDAIGFEGPFATDHRYMVDQLLSDYGQVIAPQAQVQVKAVTSAPTQSPNGPFPHSRQYSLSTGTLWADGQAARFVAPGLNVQAVGHLLNGVWSSSAIASALAELKTAGIQFTPAQEASAAVILRGSKVPMAQWWSSTILLRNARIDRGMFCFAPVSPGYEWIVLPDGRYIEAHKVVGTLDPVSGMMSPPSTAFRPYILGDPSRMWKLFAFSFVSACLGGALCVIGILLITAPRIGVLALQCWCVVKFLMIGTEIVLSFLFMRSVEIASGTPVVAFDLSAAERGGFTTAIAQAIFPIVMLFMIPNMKSLSAYFSARKITPVIWSMTGIIAASRTTVGRSLRGKLLVGCVIPLMAIVAAFHLSEISSVGRFLSIVHAVPAVFLIFMAGILLLLLVAAMRKEAA